MSALRQSAAPCGVAGSATARNALSEGTPLPCCPGKRRGPTDLRKGTTSGWQECLGPIAKLGFLHPCVTFDRCHALPVRVDHVEVVRRCSRQIPTLPIEGNVLPCAFEREQQWIRPVRFTSCDLKIAAMCAWMPAQSISTGGLRNFDYQSHLLHIAPHQPAAIALEFLYFCRRRIWFLNHIPPGDCAPRIQPHH